MLNTLDPIQKFLMLCFSFALLISCNSKTKPNAQYMPNMYESIGYETYGNYDVFPNQKEGMLPPAGTVARGWLPYEIPNTNVGYKFAKDSLKKSFALYAFESRKREGTL